MKTLLLRAFVCVALMASAIVLIEGTSQAQSPTPNWYMYDTAPKGAFPPTAPYQSRGPNAVVVEGLGSLGCSYPENTVSYYSLYWVERGYQTFTEIGPQSYCGTLSQYKTMLYDIEQYMEKNSSDPGRYWGGFMLDEESTFGFSPSQLETLNRYVASVMDSAPGMTYFFTEAVPVDWSVATYNAITTGSWRSPQVHSSTDVAHANTACTYYGDCTNAVTTEANFSYPWDDYQYTTGQTHGAPWSNSTWGSGTWANEFRAV